MQKSPSLFATAFLAAGLAAASLAESPLPLGRYEGKALGQDGIYDFKWILGQDSLYDLRLKAFAPEGPEAREAHMRGNYRVSGDSIYLRDISMETERGWQSHPDDVYTFTQVNDTTYHLVIMDRNEVRLVLQSGME